MDIRKIPGSRCYLLCDDYGGTISGLLGSVSDLSEISPYVQNRTVEDCAIWLSDGRLIFFSSASLSSGGDLHF